MSTLKINIIFASLLRNGISVLAFRICLLFSYMLMSIFLARYLGAQDFGAYTTASNIHAIFLPFILFGFGNVISREVAKQIEVAWKYLSHVLMAGLVLTIVCTFILYGFCRWVGYAPVIQQAALILALGFFPAFFINMSESLFIGLEKVHYFAYINFICSLLELGLIIFALWLGYSILTVVTIAVVIRYLFSGLLFIPILRTIRVAGLQMDWSFMHQLIRVALVFALVGIMAGLIFRISVLFLTKLASAYATGIYSAAYKVVSLWALVITSFIVSFYPIAARYYQNHSLARFQAVSNLVIKIILLLTFGAVLVTLCLSHEIVLLMFGREYVSSILVLQMLIFLLIPLCGTALFGSFLAATNQQKYDLLAISIATLFSLILNYYWVKSFSYYGSVYANLVAFSIILIIQYYFINKLIFPIAFRDGIGKPSLAFLAALAAIYFFQNTSWYLKTPIILVVYVGAIILGGMLHRQDFEVLQSE